MMKIYRKKWQYLITAAALFVAEVDSAFAWNVAQENWETASKLMERGTTQSAPVNSESAQKAETLMASEPISSATEKVETAPVLPPGSAESVFRKTDTVLNEN